MDLTMALSRHKTEIFNCLLFDAHNKTEEESDQLKNTVSKLPLEKIESILLGE